MKAQGIQVVGVAVLSAAWLGCGDGGGESDPTTPGPGDDTGVDAEVTYYRDVKPLIEAKCQTCHSDGGIAPFTLATVDEAKTYAAAMAAAVETKTMPPWLAEDGCNEYLGDRSLSDEQIQTFVRWAELEAPAGDPAVVGPPVDDTVIKLSKVDLSLAMAAPYTPQQSPDDYRCFVIDWPETSLRYVTGFNARPGNPSVVHHVIAYVATPETAAQADSLDAGEEGEGYTCFGGPGFDGAMLGGWAPGGLGSDFPAGTGIPIQPGSKIVLQVHYNVDLEGAAEDVTAVEVSTAATVEKHAASQFFTNPLWLNGDSMSIPPHQDDVSHEFSIDPTPFLTNGNPFVIYSANLHMHTLGQSGRLEIERADGTKECLLSIPHWDFHWQNNYALATPTTVHPGDRVRIQCTWDNHTAQEVTWGEGTSDEMCLGAFFITQ